MTQKRTIANTCHSEGLADILERVLDKGLVIAGDIKIKLCDIELLTIQIRLLVASADKAREMGLTWWWQTPEPPQAPHFVAGQPSALPPVTTQSPWEQYVQFRDMGQQVRE